MYTCTNYPSGAAVKRALAAGDRIEVYQPGPFGGTTPQGTVYLEGPHYPQAHKWYLSAVVVDGAIVSINK